MESDNANLEIRYLQAVNYLAGAQIYLQDNVTLREPLKPEHIKDRLRGRADPLSTGTANTLRSIIGCVQIGRMTTGEARDLFNQPLDGCKRRALM